MEYTEEIKRAFIDRMREHNVVVVSRCYGNTFASYEHKVIGVWRGLRWDFTGLIAHVTECKTNGKDLQTLAVRGMAAHIIELALARIGKELGEDVSDIAGYPRDYYAQFYM